MLRNSFSPVRICFVQPIQSPYVTERLRALAKLGDIECTLLLEHYTLANRPGWVPEPIDGIDTKILGSWTLSSECKNNDLGYRLKGIRSIPWRLPFALFKLKPDVVVVCNATQVLFALPIRFLFRNRLALIVEDTPHATSYLGFFARNIKRLMYRSADCCFAFSEEAKKYLDSIRLTATVRCSSWSLDMQDFCPKSVLVSADKEQYGKLQKTIIFVGALVEAKGIQLLLSSWAKLPVELRKNARLVIVGSGPLRGQLEEQIKQKNLTEVTMVGQVSYREVRGLMRDASLLVLPTLKDLYSLTILEAMACGCPVITTPFNGARELVEEGVTGWIVDPTQPGALVAALDLALSKNLSDLNRMGQAARTKVEPMDNRFVMNQFAQSLKDISVGQS